MKQPFIADLREFYYRCHFNALLELFRQHQNDLPKPILTEATLIAISACTELHDMEAAQSLLKNLAWEKQGHPTSRECHLAARVHYLNQDLSEAARLFNLAITL